MTHLLIQLGSLARPQSAAMAAIGLLFATLIKQRNGCSARDIWERGAWPR